MDQGYTSSSDMYRVPGGGVQGQLLAYLKAQFGYCLVVGKGNWKCIIYT